METKSERLFLEPRGDVTIVSFMDKKILDEANIQEIGDELTRLVTKDHRIKLLLNFENVEYLSSAALGKLISLHKRVREHNGQLKLCDIRPEIYEVFKITKLNLLFEIYDDEELALKTFKGSPA